MTQSAAPGQKLWGFLLVLDAFLVIVFGGALAARLYQHWQAPLLALPRRAQAARPSAPPPAKPAAAAPSPAQPAAAAPPAAPVDGTAKIKAVPTEFHYKNAHARSVVLVGTFIVHGGKKALAKRSDGLWTVTLYLTPNAYRYYFLVNGKKALDQNAAKTSGGWSAVSVGRP